MWLILLLPAIGYPSLAQDQPVHRDTVRFTVTEGTWMNLDVSPAGDSLVFDLLGDLYVLPLSGGEARRLTHGPALDIQPRYSPDGRHIAFTSDRAGGDNLWIMPADSGDAWQVTKESFRLVNGPAWTPDGEYLLGRKHFTSTRSLGAGEVWLYHRSGGSGLQLTKRKNDQQDQGNDIAVSPDGRYVYFSEDVSGGSTFQYNKDPHGQIYVIRRLDRRTGEIISLIGGPGGAVRAQPSPDGKKIAFVRRVRSRSVLFLYDVESGAQRPLFAGLSRDQQESWAIFGVYPGFDWTPDGKKVVLWANGKLWSISVESGEASEIPFTAHVEQAVAPTVRFARPAWEDTVDVRMIRQAATSPDGQTVVFQAVGRLWKANADGTEATALTQDSWFEHEPGFSPDGRFVVYTTWSDDALGSVRELDLATGRSRALTSRPGYYHTPRYARDGDRIVYRRGGGNSLLGTLHGTMQGIYILNRGSGEEKLLRSSGTDPRFDATGERVFFLTGGGLEKTCRSIGISGDREREHFTLKYPNVVVPSPDNRWVAFTELFHVYVAPMPLTGGAVALSADMKSLPVRQLTRDAGRDIHWSRDGQTLHWMIGPEYYSYDVSQLFSFSDSTLAEVQKDSTGTLVSLKVRSDRPSGTVAFTGARIITMRGEEVIENGTLVVEENVIQAVGPSATVSIPEGAHVVDASGQTIMPGIIDAHAHGNHFVSGPLPQRNWGYYANLAYGVTTLHDPSANTGTVFALSEMVKAGIITGPRIYSTGTILYGADGDFKAVVNSLEDARSHVRRMKAVGAFSVKSYNQPRREQRQQILQAAREHEMIVVPEGGATFFHNLTMIVDGHTGIEHNMPIAPLYEDVMNLWQATETGYTPTLVVSYGGLSGEYYWYQHTDVWDQERLLAFMPRGVVDARARRRTMAEEDDYYHITVAEQTKKLIDQGNTVQVGGHGQLQGLAAHWETWMLVQGGMTPHEALRSATLHGAVYLGLDQSLGSLEPGKLADLVVLDGNPLEDIRLTERVIQVMVNGRLYAAATMNEVGNHSSTRGTLFFERDEVSESSLW